MEQLSRVTETLMRQLHEVMATRAAVGGSANNPTSGRAAAPRASWGAEVATAQADMQRLIAEVGV